MCFLGGTHRTLNHNQRNSFVSENLIGQYITEVNTKGKRFPSHLIFRQQNHLPRIVPCQKGRKCMHMAEMVPACADHNLFFFNRLLCRCRCVAVSVDLPKSSYKKERDDLSRTAPH